MFNRLRVVICLFRNDLRYADHEALKWAHQNADWVVPLYCFDPRHFAGTRNYGFPKTGPFRLKFLLESIHNLRQSLMTHGSNLVVRCGKPETVVAQLISQIEHQNIHGLTFHDECTREELDVEAALKKLPVPVTTFWGSTVINREDIPFNLNQTPNDFTKFKHIIGTASSARRVIRMPEKLKPLPAGVDPGIIPQMSDLDVQEKPEDARTAFPFEGGETCAVKRVNSYLWQTDNITSYNETRNEMIGAEYSTKFSPWLAHGCITPRQIYWEARRYARQKGNHQYTYHLIYKLLLRDYFKIMALKFGDKLFYKSGLMKKHWYVDWNTDKDSLFEAWKTGQTGVPFIDANMRELATTGYMSNRGRQNVSSFLAKDLRIDWRKGAEWFESMLIDYDVCINYISWLQMAGRGTDLRHEKWYNVVKQGLVYDANGDYVQLWVPELKKIKGWEVHIPWTLSPATLTAAGVSLGVTYPRPIHTSPTWSKHYGRQTGDGSQQATTGKQQGMDFKMKGASSRLTTT